MNKSKTTTDEDGWWKGFMLGMQIALPSGFFVGMIVATVLLRN